MVGRSSHSGCIGERLELDVAAGLHYFYFVSIKSIVINSDQIHIRIEGDYHISSFTIKSIFF